MTTESVTAVLLIAVPVAFNVTFTLLARAAPHQAAVAPEEFPWAMHLAVEVRTDLPFALV
jgi:hypothetical protein